METYNSIEVTKQLVKEGKISQEIAEIIFPELKESEDEKVRKELNYFHKNAIESLELPEKEENKWEIEQHKKYIAWIEKQNEQKFPSLSEKEIVCLKRILDFLREEHNSYTGKDFTNEIAVLEWLITHSVLINSSELQPKQDEQNPAWSEEDEHRVKDTIYFLDTAKKHYASAVELDACIDWVKALKERYTWKPSDEQINALARFTTIPALESLYNDLKKLKG